MSVSTVAYTGEVEGSVVVGKLLEQDGSNFGHNATKGLFCLFCTSQFFLPKEK